MMEKFPRSLVKPGSLIRLFSPSMFHESIPPLILGISASEIRKQEFTVGEPETTSETVETTEKRPELARRSHNTRIFSVRKEIG